jgi:hypothetical protein
MTLLTETKNGPQQILRFFKGHKGACRGPKNANRSRKRP